MDLVCANKAGTNSMISAQYIVFGIAGLLFFAMPDDFGRRMTMNVWYSVHVIAQILILFNPNYWARFMALLMFGLSQMKHSVVYVWAAELVPKDQRTSVAACLTSYDSGSIFFICLYFLLISRNWFPIMLVCVIMSILSWICCLFLLPESPGWLLAQGRTQEAIAVFNLIGRVNGVNRKIPDYAIFTESEAR